MEKKSKARVPIAELFFKTIHCFLADRVSEYFSGCRCGADEIKSKAEKTGTV